MPRKSKAFLARSSAAKLGWQRRKRAERTEFTRWSKAAKKGWITRKRNVRSIKKVRRESPERLRRKKPSIGDASQTMWRVTISAPYYRRERGKRRTSISSSYMVRSWLKSKQIAQDAINEGELTELAIEGRQEILESEDRVWWTDDTVDIKIEKVSYDERLLNTIEETNEL